MTENTRDVQLKASMDATGVRAGVEQAKTALGDLGKTAEREGAKAGAGLGKAGDGAEKAGGKIDRETRSMIQSIERATAAFKAGEKGGSSYFEALAQQRSISGDALKPYLEQLRQAEASQKTAARSLDGIGMSAKATTAALRQVPAQFTDIITSLQGGQAPLTVLLQQGGQLKDVFGGVGAAARALGGYVLSLVNPLTVAAAAVAGLAFAYEKGADESRAFARTLILSGNAAGTTVDQLSTAAAGLKSFGLTQGAAAEAINQLASTGKVGAESLGRFAAVAVQLSKVGGPAVEETVKAFAELGKAPLQASLKLNESTNFLTASLYEQIKALEQQGRTTEAAKVAQDAFAAASERRLPQLAAQLGVIEKLWNGIKAGISGAGDALLSIGRADTVQKRAEQIRAELTALERGRVGSLGAGAAASAQPTAYEKALERELSLITAQKRENEKLAQQDAAQAKQVAARVEADKLLDQLGVKRISQTDQEAALRRQLTAASVEEKTIQEAIYALRKRNADSSTDTELATQRAKVREADAYLTKLKEISATGQFELLDDAKQTESQKKVIELQEQLKNSIGGVTRAKLEQELVGARALASREVEIRDTEEQIKGQKRAADEYQNLVQATTKSADAILQQALQQEAANATLGKGKTALAELTLAELQHQQAELQNTSQTTPAYLAGLQAKIDAQERFVKALKQADFKALNDGLDEWLRSAGEMDRLYQSEQQLTGLTALERDKIVAARQVELKLAKELAKIDDANIDEAQKEGLRIKARVAAEKEASAAVNKVLRDDAAKTAADIERSLTDALLRGFESGKGAAQNLRDTLVNMFKTLVLRPLIQPIVSGAAGGIGSLLGLPAQASAGGGPLGALGSLGSAGGSLGSLLGLGGYGSAFSGGAGLALSGAGGTGLALEGAGSLIGNGAYAQGFGQAAGALAPWALGAAAGIYGGRAISGGYSAVGNSGNTAVNVGTIAGAIFGGPIGAAIGGAIGGLVNRAFGRKAKETTASGLDGTASMDGFNGRQFADFFQKGGWFRSDKRGTDFSAVGAEQDGVLDAGVKALYAATADYAKVLGLPVEAVKGYAASFRVQFGKTEEENQKAIQDAFVSLGDQLAGRYAAQLAPLQKAGESLASTLQRLSTLQVFSNSLGLLGGVFSRVASSSVDAREQLIGLAGGMDALSQQALGFAQNYYSRSEIAGLKAKELQAAFSSAGIAADPNSREQFRALVEAQDPNTDAGRKQLAALLALQGSFATVADYLNESGLTLSQAAAQAPNVASTLSPLFSQQTQLTQEAVNVQYETRDATLRVVDAITELNNTLRSTPSGNTFVPSYREPEVTTAR